MWALVLMELEEVPSTWRGVWLSGGASPPGRTMTDAATNMRLKLPIACFILQIILIILFGVLVQYDHETDAKAWHNQSHSDYDNDFYFRYPTWTEQVSESRGPSPGGRAETAWTASQGNPLSPVGGHDWA
ncbi:Ammonium transporter Rh type B [Liparis tanakae]|uniref:Ammonium transporter Rh type B n=1 Tax=Liparis tanakae TaxID=230148 RepID=A0A4Z2EFG3_9TELE|nr:Ammonium transporter Rh type B [Liparis tanakae]